MQDNGSLINNKLFSDDTQSVFAILDGASVPTLLGQLLKERPEYVCLYRGDLAPDMASVAPYLIHLQVNTPFTEWLVSEGWGKHWGVFVTSPSDLRTLRQHFRSLLTVYDPEAKPMLFRYYDPRVLNTFLPTCNPDELAAMFGPVGSFLLEQEDGQQGCRFYLSSGSLKSEKFEVKAE